MTLIIVLTTFNKHPANLRCPNIIPYVFKRDGFIITNGRKNALFIMCVCFFFLLFINKEQKRKITL